MTIPFSTFAKIEKVANAGRQGSNLSSGKKGGGGGEGTTDSVAEDTGTDGPGTDDAVEVSDSALAGASGTLGEFFAAKTKADKEKRASEAGELKRRKMMRSRGGERIVPESVASAEQTKLDDPYSDDSYRRGYQLFAPAGKTPEMMTEGIARVESKIVEQQNLIDQKIKELGGNPEDFDDPVAPLKGHIGAIESIFKTVGSAVQIRDSASSNPGEAYRTHVRPNVAALGRGLRERQFNPQERAVIDMFMERRPGKAPTLNYDRLVQYYNQLKSESTPELSNFNRLVARRNQLSGIAETLKSQRAALLKGSTKDGA